LSPSPSPRQPRTARERVAQRRAAHVGAQGARPANSRRRGPRGCNTLLIGGLLLLAIVGVVAAVVVGRARSTLQALEQADPRQQAPASAGAAVIPAAEPESEEPPAGAPSITQLPGALQSPFNVLLVGVDKRANRDEGVRSDTLILVHVNPQGRWASMLSIPRDSVVTIPHLGQQKINVAFSYGYDHAAEIYGANTTPDAGGGALAAETVEGFLGVHVDYVAQVDFRGFERIVDTLGGVLVDVQQPLLDAQFPTEDYGVERIYIPAGLQRMDGATALRYARSRHGSSDFDRSRRQQQVLQAIMSEVRGRGLLDQAALLPELARDLEQSVSTTLPVSDLGTLQGLAALARELKPANILRLSINPNDVALLQEAGSDLYWDAGDIAALVRRMQEGPAPAQAEQPAQASPEVARVQVQNGAGVEGLASRVSAALLQQGFSVADAADAPAPYDHTLIIDYAGRPETRARLTALLGIDPRFVQATPDADAPPAPPGAEIVVILGADYQPHWVGQ
jgi:LCP family protein required for cell wall assembly